MFTRTAALLVAGIAALFPVTSFAQEKLNLRFLTSWDPNFIGTEVGYKKFVDDVVAASGGRITFTVNGPEVVPGNQQFEPVTRGVFDIGYTTPIYYLGTTGLLYAYFALPQDSEMWREKGYWDIADKELQRFNQKILALFPASPEEEGYQILLREPLGEGDQALAGKKIRGNKSYEPIVGPLGGSLVNLPTSETYSALEKGVVDGAAFPVVGMEQLKMQEVTKYMMRPRFGTLVYTIAMNLDKFNALSKEDQELLLKAGRDSETGAALAVAAAGAESIAALKAAGMQETVLDPAVFEKLNAGMKAAIWKDSIAGNQQTAARVEELYEMAKKNGDAE